jgi:uncharacterized membrane protein YecN with MAPEG domain
MGQYVPFALFLMLLVEQGGASAWALHALGLLLIAGSLLHLWGFARFPGQNTTPQLGTLLISLAYLLACLIGLGQVLGGA